MSLVINYARRMTGLNRNAKLYLVHSVLSGLGLALLVLLYNLYILSLGYKQDMIGLVTLVASTVAVCAALPMGYVVNRLGYRRALTIGALGTAVSIASPLVVPTPEALIATEVIWGFAFTLLVIIGAPFMSENSTNEERPYLFSIQFVLLTLTAFIGNLAGGELPRILGGWLQVAPESPEAYRAALGIAVVLILFSAVPFLFVVNAPQNGKQEHIGRPRLVIQNRGMAARLVIPIMIGALAGGMFVPFANVFWRDLHDVGDGTIGMIFAASALIMAMAGMFSPMLGQRFGMVRVMVGMQAVAVIGMLVFGFSPWLTIALAGFLARDVLMNLTRPLSGHFMMEQSAPQERAALSAISTMAFSLAWGVGSFISGNWQTSGQYSWVFGVSAFFYAISLVLLFVFFQEKSATSQGIPTAAMGSPAE